MKVYIRQYSGKKRRVLATFTLAAIFCAVESASAQLTTMPLSYPPDPKEYIDKWDPFVMRPLPGINDPFPLANGRQIARDTAGNWFVLVEKDRRSLFLAWGRGQRIAGGQLAILELAGSERGALFATEGEVTGAGMVIDAGDRLHVIWRGPRGLWYVTASLKGTASEGLRDRRMWTQPRTLVEAPCHPGDIMLDAHGDVVVSYSRNDTVYYMLIASGKAEAAAGIGAGMPTMAGLSTDREATTPDNDDATPSRLKKKPAGDFLVRPFAERECQEAVMDLAPDGTVYLAFRRDFELWVTRRTREGAWLPAERVAQGLAFHPSLVVSGGRPLVCFQFFGIKSVTLGGENYLRQREGGDSSVGFATRTNAGWSTGYLAESKEIIVNRQGIWDRMFKGRVIPMMELMGPPILFRDRHGVAWAMWQNTTRRWSYCSRWMGDHFGQVQECRGPFNAPGTQVSAEKLMPATAVDVGVLFVAANRIIFDRLRVPTLSIAEARQVLFLDNLEVGETSGVEFALNQMSKSPANPVLSPGAPGSRDDRHVRVGPLEKHGSTYVMRYNYHSWKDGPTEKSGPPDQPALAISRDGVHWQKVEKLPDNLPPLEPGPDADNPAARGYFDNPDQSDRAKRFMRTVHFGDSGWARGSYRVQYSPDGKQWTDGPETSVFNAFREGSLPNLWDPLDVPERRIKAYGRVYTTNARSCGVMWSADLLHWSGAENFLDPDDPYGTPPPVTPVGPLRAQVALDAAAGKEEDQIYSCSVRIADGLYLMDYLPCTSEHRFEVGLAVSRDGINFTRVKNGESIIPVGPAGSWDSGIVMNKRFERDGDVVRVYYDGTAWHHGTEEHSYPAMQIGVATVRANGWTFYTPKSNADQGTVTTIPIQAPAGVRKGLTVNVEGIANPARGFAVEVLEAATGKPIQGFGIAECVSPTGDGLTVPVTWKAGSALPVGKDIRLRFHLRAKGVRLYSFGFRTVD